MRLGVTVKYIGVSLLWVAAFMFISAGVSAIYGMDDGFWPLIVSGCLAGVLGAFPSIFVRGKIKLKREEGFYIVVGSWTLASILGMMPYLMYGGEFTFTNALFESVSGFTTTGASILNDIESLPHGLLFWRMSTAWIGGVGIIALFSILLPTSQGNDNRLTGVEMSQIARSSANLRKVSFTRITILTYIVLTIAAILSLKISGMGWFDAVTHGMSACSTCGFSTKNASIAAFNSPVAEAVLIVFMLLASTRFVLLGRIFTKAGLRNLLKSDVTRCFYITFFAATAIITINLISDGNYGNFGNCLRHAAFQVASISSTTGYATTDTTAWPAFAASMIIALSLICGCSGSTSGGIKMDRALIAFRSLHQQLLELRSPNRVSRVHLENRTISGKSDRTVLVFIISYLVILALGALINSLCGMEIREAWTGSLACIGNVGPGMGSIGSCGNFAGVPMLAKYNSMALMIIGRLELFPVLYFIGLKSS